MRSFWPLVLLVLQGLSAAFGGPSTSKKVPRGFVTTRGRDFVLDGKKFVRVPNSTTEILLTDEQAFVGANSYAGYTVDFIGGADPHCSGCLC